MSELGDLASLRTLRLTTIGRKSGQKRTADVWFVVDGDVILVQAGVRGQKGWYVNARHNPSVDLELGGRSMTGVAEHLSGEDEERVAALFRRKYWLARVARWFGSQIGRGKPVRIRVTPN